MRSGPKTRKRSIINILQPCVAGLVSKNFRTSPAGASPPTSPAHGAYKFKRQPTGDVLAIDRIKEIHAHRRRAFFELAFFCSYFWCERSGAIKTGKEVLSERGLGLLLFWSCCETCAGAQSEKPTGLRDQPVRSTAPHCDSSRRQLREARKTATDPDSEQY